MKDYIIFNLAKKAPSGLPQKFSYLTLYEQIKQGLKTSEYRWATPRWANLLLGPKMKEANPFCPADLTKLLRVRKAWFVTGYPKGSLPRIEADIIALKYWPDDQIFEVMIANPEEKAEKK